MAFKQAPCNSERQQTQGFIFIDLIGLFLYIIFTQNLENMFEFAFNARRQTRNFFFSQ